MSRPLRIAFFTGIFPAVSETFILRQITGLLDMGHEVDIYADSAPELGTPVHAEVTKYALGQRTTYMDMPPETAPWEMPVWPVTGRTWPPGAKTSILNSARIIRALPKLLRSLMVAPGLARQVLKQSEYGYQAASLSALYRLAKLCSRRKDYDVLHAHFGPVGISFRFARNLWKAPLVVSFHGYDFSSAPRKDGSGMYAKLFDSADAITVNSDYTRSEVQKLGCPVLKLHKLPVGLNPDEFSFSERTGRLGEPVRILTVARLVKIKGHEFSLRAFAKVRQKHPRAHYDIVGDGPMRSELEKLAAQLGLRDAVTFHGACDGAQVQRYMAESQIFLLASVSVEGDREGQGLVLQEAQATGLPVVATAHGGLPEGMLADKSGFLVHESDVGALAERLSFLIEHPETWPEIGRQGRAFVEERFDSRNLNRQLVKLYERIVASSDAAPKGRKKIAQGKSDAALG